MNSFLLSGDANGRSSACFQPSSLRYALVLTANVQKSVSVPANARLMLMNATGPVWVQYGAPAAIPAIDDVSGGAAELNPSGREIAGIGSLGLIAPAACSVSISFFA